MIWLFIAVIAHFFYAFVFIIDKYIVSRSLPHPIVYSFYVGVLGFLILFLVPFGFYFPSFNQLLLVFVAGVFQVVGWIFMYRALNRGEVSRVVPFIGGFVALFTLLLSKVFINEKLTTFQLIAFILLVLGVFILSLRKTKLIEKIAVNKKNIFSLAIFSSFCFAAYWVITKYIFLEADFITGLIWLRTVAGLVVLTLLIPKKNRQLIFRKTEKLKKQTIKFVFMGRILSVLGALGVYLAVYLGSVTLVNSLQGIQYAFILFLALIFFKKHRNLREEISREIIVQKIIAIILIGTGLALLII